MNTNEAIYQYATFVLKNKNEVIDLINSQGLGSLTYSSPIDEVNYIVIDNLYNKRFISGMDSIMKEGYDYLEPITTVAIIVSIITVGLGTAQIVTANRNARKIRAELIREGYRTQYLKQDELNQIAFLERERLQDMFLDAQTDFLQRKENADALEKEEKDKAMVMIVILGMVSVIVVAGMVRK